MTALEARSHQFFLDIMHGEVGHHLVHSLLYKGNLKEERTFRLPPLRSVEEKGKGKKYVSRFVSVFHFRSE